MTEKPLHEKHAKVYEAWCTQSGQPDNEETQRAFAASVGKLIAAGLIKEQSNRFRAQAGLFEGKWYARVFPEWAPHLARESGPYDTEEEAMKAGREYLLAFMHQQEARGVHVNVELDVLGKKAGN